MAIKKRDIDFNDKEAPKKEKKKVKQKTKSSVFNKNSAEDFLIGCGAEIKHLGESYYIYLLSDIFNDVYLEVAEQSEKNLAYFKIKSKSKELKAGIECCKRFPNLVDFIIVDLYNKKFNLKSDTKNYFKDLNSYNCTLILIYLPEDSEEYAKIVDLEHKYDFCFIERGNWYDLINFIKTN